MYVILVSFILYILHTPTTVVHVPARYLYRSSYYEAIQTSDLTMLSLNTLVVFSRASLWRVGSMRAEYHEGE
jgi:hypothetical protein